jgi:catechol 2,3-dioxygenase-like lactoylglutathione lyase family enzyme
MAELDHMILRVSNPTASIRFYEDLLGFKHEGRVGPFEVVRVSEGFPLDLLAEPPTMHLHLAFRVDPEHFERVMVQLRERRIPFGGNHMDRSGSQPQPQYGARGLALACYFEDPDGHNLEIRY